MTDPAGPLDGVGRDAPDPSEPRGGAPLIFFCDVSAEAQRLTALLRERGFEVVDVPVGMLVGRLRVQMPDLILCDLDEQGALDATRRLREVPGGSSVDVVFIGDPKKTDPAERDSLEHEASGLFLRPVDGDSLIGTVEALIGPGPGPGSHPAPPVGPRPSRLPLAPDSSIPPPKTLDPFLPNPGTPEAAMPRDAEGAEPRRASALSDAVTELLERAEARIGGATDDGRRSPRDEIRAVLPDELLRSLDETLEADADPEDGERASGPPRTGGVGTGTGTGTGTGSQPTGTVGTGNDSTSWSTDRGTRQTAATGGALGALGSSATSGAMSGEPATADLPPLEQAPVEQAPVYLPPVDLPAVDLSSPQESLRVALPEPEASPEETSEHPSTVPPGPRTGRTASGSLAVGRQRDEPPARIALAPLGSVGAQAATAQAWSGPASATLGPGDLPREFGRAVRERFTGALAIESQESIRRVVLHDGDVVTVVSSAESESLVSFLVARGSLRQEVGDSLRRRMPRFGRHAVAALIANGQLTQDQLWPVLRAHADWLLTRVLRVDVGVVSIESDVPTALASEPSVFGGGTGAEAFIDGMLRAFSTAEATARLGGAQVTFDAGTAGFLLNECGLTGVQRAKVDAIGEGRPTRLPNGGSSDAGSSDAVLFYALTLLGVVQIARGQSRGQAGSRSRPRPIPQDSVALDAAAIRERIAARHALVREGDYYAVLGVARGATEHEIRRAYDALREELDPARVITGRTADLAEDLDVIIEVIDEAYEILNDPTRRARYLAAIEATPRSR